MTTVLIILSLLLLPGVVVASCLQLPKGGLTLVLCLSYGVFLVNVFITKAITSPDWILYIYGVEFVCLILWASTIWITRGKYIRDHIYKRCWQLWPQVVIILTTGIYIVLVGPYLEVPADVWQHLGAIADYKQRLEFGVIDINQPWYFLYAMALSFSGEQLHQTIVPFTVVGTILFMTMIGGVSRLIYLGAGYEAKRANLFALVSALLTLGLFGTSVFSFVRYYVYSPAYFSYPIFLLGVYLTTSVQPIWTMGRIDIYKLLLIGICIAVTYFLHKQEAMFLVIFIGAYASYFAGQCIWKNVGQSQIGLGRYYCSRRLLFGALVVGLLVVLLLGMSRYIDGASLNGQMPLRNNTILLRPFGDIVWILADPKGRAYETIGVWGLIVLIIYFSLLGRRDRIFCLTMMASLPFLLIFNPIFTYVFLPRVGGDVLWRLTYMIPIGLIGANVIEVALMSVFYRKVKKIIIISLILLAMIPLTSLETIQNSRWQTLKRVADSNSYRIWDDLLAELRRYPDKNVLTDPITGYIVRALTGHTVFGSKFHSEPPFIPINYSGYGSSSFRGYQSWLFIHNSRDGTVSKNGEISGHWPVDVMQVSSRYSKKLRGFLENPPSYFHLLWESDGIRIFEIKDD